jgi:dynein heavy chain
MQVHKITQAKKLKLRKFTMPGEVNDIGLKPQVGYFITMNPGYAGRQELPENLKVLFRYVAMMVPDRRIIMKVKLASVGFSDFEPLSVKFFSLYGLCEEQLSNQRHYDFGLRNILSVLRTCGATKRENLDGDEEMLCMRTLRDMNLSKLVADDVLLFQSLLADIFPKQKEPQKMVYENMEAGIEKQFKKLMYQNTDKFHLKVVQLYETQVVRHGYMLIGLSGVGKSVIIEILTESFADWDIQTRVIRMNPKAITDTQMYGKKSATDEWTPGVFSKLWETYIHKNKSSKNWWLCCDGPVDTLWIESLNTVLDDNRILTLASGDRLPMSENLKLVFEVENLNNASPATVSRCGIVYVDPLDLGYPCLIRTYI